MDFKFELFPLHSPLLGESLLVSFPPLNNMLKFRGSSHFIWGLIHRWLTNIGLKTHLPRQNNRTTNLQQKFLTQRNFLPRWFTRIAATLLVAFILCRNKHIFNLPSMFICFFVLLDLGSEDWIHFRETNLPPTHTVVRLRFKGKGAETPYPQTVVHQ